MHLYIIFIVKSWLNIFVHFVLTYNDIIFIFYLVILLSYDILNSLNNMTYFKKIISMEVFI